MLTDRLKKIRLKYNKNRNFDKKQAEKEREAYIQLRKNISSFLWNLCNQPEKLPGNIKSLVDEVYGGYGKGTKQEIIDKIKKAVENGVNNRYS